MPVAAELSGDSARTLGRPPQGRLRITPRVALDQRLQRGQQPRIGDGDGLPPRPRPPNPPRRERGLGPNFPNAPGDGFPRQSAHAVGERHPAVAQAQRFIGHREATRPFVQVGPNRPQLPPEFGQDAHAMQYTTRCSLIPLFVNAALAARRTPSRIGIGTSCTTRTGYSLIEPDSPLTASMPGSGG